MERRRTSPHLLTPPFDRYWLTDKVDHGYAPTYVALAATLNDIRPNGPAADFDVLEIGVANGAGMAMFRDIFGTVTGVDNRPETPAHIHADQADPDLWAKLGEATKDRTGGARPLFDVIVDDASHDPQLTRQTLLNMWPAVRPGGFYVVEDWNHINPMRMWSALWLPVFGSIILRNADPTSTVAPAHCANVEWVAVREEGMIIMAKARQVGWTTTPAGYTVPEGLDDDPRLWTGEG